MSTLAGDFWVCGDCRSINNAGARQCYNCRTPRDRAAVDPSDIDPSTHGKLREIELPEFRSSRWAAMLASILILAVAVMQVVQFNLTAALLNQILGGVEATDEQFIYVGSVGILAFGIALLALIAWALWLSRTVTSMPALGLGYPAANGMMAFIENFIPVLNLWRVPAIVRDVVRRLEPKTGGDEVMTRGESLVFAAWISIFAGYLVPRILGFFTSDIRTLITIAGIGTGLVVVGAIFLVVLIWWIEGRILKRREVQLAEGGGAAAAAPGNATTAPMQTTPAMQTTPPLQTTPAMETAPAVETMPAVQATPAVPAPLGAPDVVQTRSAFAATASTPPSTTSSFRLPGVGVTPSEPPPPPSATEPEGEIEREMEPWATTADVAAPNAEAAPGSLPAQGPGVSPEVEPGPAVASGPTAPPMTVPAATDPEPPVQTIPEPEPAAPPPPAQAPEPAADPTPVAAAPSGPPNLTIRVSSRGMMTAEMDGEIEHVMVDDLGSYAEALSHVGGTATIIVPSDDGMAGLISKRAQRILEDAGVQVTIP